jgi:acetaldehyde dehydrogenase/alcohol dehydrogenase
MQRLFLGCLAFAFIIAACRNAIVMSPHVRAAKCSIEAARIVREAAEKAGAPKGLIQWIERPSLALATALMKDPKINLILATGQCQSIRWTHV